MIDVCYITDRNYLIAAMTAVKSLILNNKKEKLIIHVICYDLAEEDTNFLKQLQTKNVRIDIILIKELPLNIEAMHPYVTKTSLLKFYIPELIKDTDKVLYLDDDILVRNSIKELYNCNLENYYAAVVADMHAMMKGHAKKIGHEKYFNSGMMLLNLSNMRKDKITEKLIDYKKNETFDDFMDQNAFNKIFAEKVLYLSPKYNYLKTIDCNDFKLIAEFYNLSEREIRQISKSPIILHLAGGLKPWISVLSASIGEYLKYLFMLPECPIKKETIKRLFEYDTICELYKKNPAKFIKHCLKQVPLLREIIYIYEDII